MRVLTAFVLAVAAVWPASSFSESLDDVGGRLLSQPKVQADLGITVDQLDAVRNRQFRQLFKMMVTLLAVVEFTRENVEFASDASYNAKFSEDTSLCVADLTTGQKGRLRQIAAQLSVVDALACPEMEVALGLTPDQQSTLAKLRADRPKPVTRNYDELFTLDWEKAKKELEASKDADGKIPGSALASTIDKFTDSVVKTFERESKLLPQRDPAKEKKMADQSLAALTEEQRKKLRELQGRPLRD